MNNNSLGLVSLFFGLLMAGIICLVIIMIYNMKLTTDYYVCGAIITATVLISVFYYAVSNYSFLGIIVTLLLVFFIAYIVSVLIYSDVISFVKIKNDDLFFFILLMIQIAIIIVAILCGFYGRNFILETKTYDQVVLLSAIVCFNCSVWFVYLVGVLFLFDEEFTFQKINISKLLPFLLLNIVGIITGVILCVKYITIAKIQEILFSWVRSPTNSESVLIGICLWVVLPFGIVWTLFFIVASIIYVIDNRRRQEISALFYEVENIQQFIMRLSAYSQKHKISNSDFEEILFATRDRVLNERIKRQILWKYKEFDFEKSIKKMNEEVIRELLIPEYNLKEATLLSSSVQFKKRYNEDIFGIIERSNQSGFDKNLYYKYSVDRRRSRRRKILYNVKKRIKAKENNNERMLGKKIIQVVKPEVSLDDGPNTVSMVRDIYHHTKTPLRIISQASKNMELLKGSPERQEEYLRIITNQVSLVELILDGYRELSMGWTDSNNSENIRPYLEYAAQSAAAMDGKTISLSLPDPFPEQLCYQGNRYAAIILKPLIDNAVEASPNGESVIVRCIENDNECIVSIENKCIITPRQSDLETPNFTTKKTGGGDGLTSVRKLVKKGNFGFSIKASEETNTVMAEVKFLKTRN